MVVVEKEELGLSLSLSVPKIQNSSEVIQLNILPSMASTPFSFSSSSAAATPQFNVHLQKNSNWFHNLSSSDPDPKGYRVEGKAVFLKGIDVNRSPTTADIEEEEETGVSSPNSTISSISGKRSEREATFVGDDHDAERASSRGISDEEDGETSRKKLRLSKDQSAVLEESFKEHNTLNPKQKLALAKRLGLTPRQVEVWFQNRRARTKLKQTEVDCEFLKRCCENLTEENRRLQKELQELRTLKLSPQFYMQMNPPTTLTMCPSCERVATGPPSSSSTVAQLPTPPQSSHVDPRTLHLVHAHQQRPIPFNLWATEVHRPLDALKS